ncbi:MAG: HEPN domain-containing protein [Candidatus Parvarchaeota archaeon]
MKIVYLGFLGNCDNSIFKVRFGKDFEIGSMSYSEAIAIISKLRGSSAMDSAMIILRKNLSTSSDNPVYFIRKEQDVPDSPVERVNGIPKYYLDLLNDGQVYLTNKIRLLRIIKNGFATLPIQFVYREDTEIVPLIGLDDGKSSIRAICHIEDNEVEAVNNFISENELPFNDGALQLALDSYELSYYTTNPRLSFTSSMIAIESLLNPGEGEVSYRVSRNLAALLGKDLQSSMNLYEKMRKLYRVRSSIAHGAKSEDIKSEDLEVIRELARLAIVTYKMTGFDRNRILDELHLMGFREKRPWKIPSYSIL